MWCTNELLGPCWCMYVCVCVCVALIYYQVLVGACVCVCVCGALIYYQVLVGVCVCVCVWCTKILTGPCWCMCVCVWCTNILLGPCWCTNGALIPNSAPYRGADKSLVRPGRKQATATDDFDVHISFLQSYLEEY